MHNSAILSLFLMWSRKFLLISMLLILLTFINIFYDTAFSSENKTLKYIFEPFLKLNGTDFYDIENNDQLQLEEFTLATWFRTNQSCSCEPSHIVNKGGFNNERPGKNMNYGVWMNTDGTITAGFESQRGKNFEILSQKKYNDGKWHYVIVLYNSTVLRVDIDGNTIGNLKISKTPDTKGNQPLRLGANSLDLDKYFNGEVDEVRIWNRGLAINELSEIYTNRNFTTNGQVEYLNFGKNIINNDKELIYNNSITKSTKEFQRTLGTTKQPQVIFIFVIPKDTLQELESGATKKQQPPIVENNTQTVKNENRKTNTTKEELLATLTSKQQPPTIVENQTSGKIKTNVTKEGLPTTKIPVTPTKTNVTKEGLPTITPTIKNVTKQEIPTIKNVTKQEIPTITPTIKNVTKEGLPTTTTPTIKNVTKQETTNNKECYKRRTTNNNTNNKECYKRRNTNNKAPTIKNVTKEGLPTIKNVTKEGLPTTTPTIKNVTKEGLPTTTPTIKNVTKQEIPTIKNVTKEGLPTIKNVTKEGLPTITPTIKNVTKEGLPTITPTIKNVTKQEIPTIKNVTKEGLPTIKNVTKEGLPTITPTIKIPIVENQTSNRIMTEPTLLPNNTSNTANVNSDKINLVFENLSVNRSVTNSVEIKGEIKNNTPLDLQEIKISAEYYNKTGTLLAKVEHFITSPSYIVKPNQLISFNILEVLGFGFDKLGDYNIFASGESINEK